MLNYLNNKFINSAFKTKIELYLLPLLLLYLCYFLLDFNLNQNLEIKEIKAKVDLNYSNKEFKDSFLDLFSNLEDYALQNQIIIFTLTNNKKVFTIKAKANLIKIENFIKKIENLNNFSKIKTLTLNKLDLDNYIFEMEVDLNKFYIKKLHKDGDIQEIKQKVIITNNEKTKEYKINAIISDYAFINELWLKKDEKIDDLILTKIEKNFVILENEEKKIILELNNENNIKNLN
ncbi:hypothetical protein [Arcobacter caeni]|uniref:Uncharacterized protein n=1 Tax=Arcobacter caeni TaxID=1912877 RepID=A0A363D2C5_9BACT|nr:hypothetical protein [Arcobacter caeni]PUE65498.1 hypothetical protein B0174_04030 [Arcobacter caeni]